MLNDIYIDFIYDFKGQWDVPSKCGLKIIKTPQQTIVFATELYESNPGTSVTKWIRNIALQVCNEYLIKPEEIYIIEHISDTGSKLDFYKETFFHVLLSWNGTKFDNPQWISLSKAEVEKLIS